MRVVGAQNLHEPTARVPHEAKRLDRYAFYTLVLVVGHFRVAI